MESKLDACVIFRKDEFVVIRYNGPMIPPRIAANVRKRAVIEGTYGSFIPHIGWLFYLGFAKQ